MRLRHKIEKSSAAKQRKQRKDGKKNPQWTSRLKKDPGIPNLFPFKDKILAEVEESKRRKEEEMVRRRQIAKAQREGRTLAEVAGEEAAQRDGDDELMDPMDDEEEIDGDDDEVMDDDNSNPMAALLASAQARATELKSADADEDEDEEDEDEEDEELLKDPSKQKPTTARKAATATAPVRKTLPKQALADPIKTVTTLVTRLQSRPAETGNPAIKVVVDYYALPALPDLPPTEAAAPTTTTKKPTGKSPADRALESWTTRFLVEVARKRGRLGKGGIPNLNAAALTVLGDLNEGRLVLPAIKREVKKNVSAGDSTVTIVETMAEPFRIEGLFGDTYAK